MLRRLPSARIAYVAACAASLPATATNHVIPVDVLEKHRLRHKLRPASAKLIVQINVI